MNRRQLMAAGLAALCSTAAPLASAGLAGDDSEFAKDELENFDNEAGYGEESEGYADSGAAAQEASGSPTQHASSSQASNRGTTASTAKEPTAVVAYAVYMCVVSGFVYDEAKGMPEDGIPAGTLWADLPADWTCPDCGVTKEDFEMIPT